MNWFKKGLPTWTGRTGLVEFEINGAGLLNKGAHYECVAEVQELDRKGSLSKLRVVSVSGIPKHYESKAAALVPKWTNSGNVEWLTTGSES